jgi:uncharacterized membrane protein (DUF106 family)
MNFSTFQKQFRHLNKKLRPLARHRYFVLTMVILLSLIVAVYLMTQTLNSPTDDDYRNQKENESIQSRFDTKTIDKIEALQKSSEAGNSAMNLPPNTRINPFAE